jgi:Fe-S-cluster containining protein
MKLLENKKELRSGPHKCQGCGKCCHAFGITLSIADMNREPRLWSVAVPIQRVGNPKTRAFMAERKHPWIIGGKPHRGAPCIFLTPVNKCSIYKTRPQICRDYPMDGYCIKDMKNASSERNKF